MSDHDNHPEDPDAGGPDELTVSSWTDLAGLPDDMDVLAEQLRSLTRYARRWVCQSAGFEPSPVCLFRPLGRVMDVLATGFSELEEVASSDWAELRADVVATTSDLRAVDERVADALPGLPGLPVVV